ncbi:MAG: Histone transcription regulator 3 [Thelocarpon impressellum]|nr:MAG: Histone transcription regulator 3 [Thelocarpon impressellum]
MSVFTALNIIPDDDSDEDVDNTKEIQIEEALKLYQTALKLHSEGPASFDEAYEAYDALFRSEIFSYPESLPEPRTETLDLEDNGAEDYTDELVKAAAGSGAGSDGVPSTLPQILYLAYKNRGQFGLDRLRHQLENDSDRSEVAGAVATTLTSFSVALTRDESDLELWRRTSRVGTALGSSRISRFCLETVLGEKVAVDGKSSPLGLEEAIAATEEAIKDSATPSEGDVKMEGASGPEAQEVEEGAKEVTECTAEKPTSKKRNLSAAGLAEEGEGGRVRSKRIRARESTADRGPNEEKAAQELAKQVEEQMRVYNDSDAWLFEVLGGLLQRLGVAALGTPEAVKEASAHQTPPLDVAIGDLHSLLRALTDDPKHNALRWEASAVGSNDPITSSTASRKAGLAAFLERAKNDGRKATDYPILSGDEGLAAFATRVNQGWLNAREATLEWLDCLLKCPSEAFPGTLASSYRLHSWPDSLKEAVVQVLVHLDEPIYDRTRRQYLVMEERIESPHGENFQSDTRHADFPITDMAQSIFELHLDVYERITNPSSEVDTATITAQRDRLERWACLASDLINVCSFVEDSPAEDSLYLRYLWASAAYAGLSEGVSQEHVILCMADLRHIIRAMGDTVVKLQNNATMPEISSAAAGREISRLTTMDFFFNIFQAEKTQPLVIIEALEPVLDPYLANQNDLSNGSSHDEERLESAGHSDSPPPAADIDNGLAAQTQELSKFLEGSSASLRLFLWKRLQEAYAAIDYSPKVMSCHFRSMEIIMEELKSEAYRGGSAEHRQATLFKWLPVLDDKIVRALTLALNDPSSFDCFDELHLASSLTALANLCRFLYAYTSYEDGVRAEKAHLPKRNDRPPPSAYVRTATKLREMQMRVWTLLYMLLKEGMVMNKSDFPEATEELVEYLRAVHHATGIRLYCGASNKVFLKFMRMELLNLGEPERRESDLVQVLFDLYGFRLCSGKTGVEDHGCSPGQMDRKTAVHIMDFVMMLVKRISLRDLPKTDYKAAMDKLQQSIGAPKQTSAMLHNMRVLAAFMRSSVNPINLYRSLKGQFQISSVPVLPETSKIADKGWYLLLGNMALARFRFQKRVSQGPTDDLDLASYFFRLDLQYSTERWEAWYRQAQTFDSRIEEAAVWSADNLNKDKAELNLLQRNAIHCYTMAVSTAFRSADPSPETAAKISGLFSDFGTRVYASSRPPFGMEAFWLDDFERHFSGTGMMYKKPLHAELSDFKAWKFASVLFKNALLNKPDSWQNFYMMGKCLWKMYNHKDNQRDEYRLVEARDVIRACVRSIETIPERKSERQDPILEPHYKLVSIVHKLVQKREIEPLEGSEILDVTSYARKVPPAQDMDGWDPYVLQILKLLRAADRLNWHHRMLARAAHIIYDDSASDILAAAAARHELSQQIFTKTMAIQVWKPEHERAGRHYVYTSRYVDFVTRLLVQLNDRIGMEALVRRVRRKSSDFFDHTRVWARVCSAHINLLRYGAQVIEGHEDAVFKPINNEEFQTAAVRMEAWVQRQTSSSPVLDVLRDAIELKKINNGLMKVGAIDDLIADTYARLYETVVPGLSPGLVPQEKERNMMSVTSLIMNDGTNEGPKQIDVPAPKPHRVKGVGRREVLRKAEVTVAKPIVVATPTSTVKSQARPTTDVPERTVAPQATKVAPADVEGGPPASSPLESPPDSGDETIDEEGSGDDSLQQPPLPPPLFPNLGMGAVASGGVTEGEGEGEEAEEGGDEADGEGEGEGSEGEGEEEGEGESGV